MVRNGSDRQWSTMIPESPMAADLIAPEPAGTGTVDIGDKRWSMRKLWAAGRSVGRGRVLVVPGADLNGRERGDIIAHYNHYLADYGSYENGALIDGKRDQVQCTLMADRILMFNGTDKPIEKRLQLRAADFGRRVGTPARLDQNITLHPNEILAVQLKLSDKFRLPPSGRFEPTSKTAR